MKQVSKLIPEGLSLGMNYYMLKTNWINFVHILMFVKFYLYNIEGGIGVQLYISCTFFLVIVLY